MLITVALCANERKYIAIFYYITNSRYRHKLPINVHENIS